MKIGPHECEFTFYSARKALKIKLFRLGTYCNIRINKTTDELQMIDSYDKIYAVLERVAAVREKCGKYFGIAIDFHGRAHKPMAKVLARKFS